MRAAVLFTILARGEEANAPRMNASTESLEIISEMGFAELRREVVVVVSKGDPTTVGVVTKLEATTEGPFAGAGLSAAEAVPAGEAEVFVFTGFAVGWFAEGYAPAHRGSVGRER